MVANCFALGCSERMTKGTPYTFHRVPRNRELAKQWQKALGREDTDYSKLKHVKVCSKHFDPQRFTVNQRGFTLIPGTLPTLNLGLDGGGRSVLDKDGRKRTRKIPLHFGDYSEEQIKKSPREALHAFRLAKLVIKHKQKRIEKLSYTQKSLWKRLIRAKIQIDEMPIHLRKELGLNWNLIGKNPAQDHNPKKKKKKKDLLSKPEKNTQTNKTSTVEVKEEPLSESDKEPEKSKSDSDPELSDSGSDSSDLMDEDDWVETFREDPEDEEVLGIPVQGGLKVENTATRLPVIKSVSSLCDMPQFPPTPILQNEPVPPVMLSNGSTSPLCRNGMTAPFRCCPSTVKHVPVSYGGPIIRKTKSTQTELFELLDSGCLIGADDAESEEGDEETYDRFGAFVARRLNGLGKKAAKFLQTEFGTLLYRVEKGDLLLH